MDRANYGIPLFEREGHPVENRVATNFVDHVKQLLEYCRSHGWAGYDPYDGLNSRLIEFAGPFCRPLLRLAWIQTFKRNPLNMRKLLLVPRGLNPKGVALFVKAMIVLCRCGLAEPGEVKELVGKLLGSRSEGWANACWGYNFDWQTRSYLVPKGTPNIICTCFAASALLDAYEGLGDPLFLQTAESSGRFLIENLQRTTTNGSEFCFSYTPVRQSLVHNANLLGAALLARLYHQTGTPALRETSIAAASFSINRQRADGSWPYGEERKQEWVDSFHTGYNLLALWDLWKYAQCEPAAASLGNGFRHYLSHFFPGSGIVRYYQNRTYPVDTHAVAHAILTLVQLRDLEPGNLDLAQEIFEWALREMQSPHGYFYYQKWRWFTNRIPYMRWSQAWMLYAMARFVEEKRWRATTN